MTLRLKINLIVGALTVLFMAGVLALQLRSMRDSVHEEVVAANRVASQLLDRTAWRYAAQGTPAMLSFLQGIGRIRSNDVTLYDAQGNELYRSPPSPYKAGRDAPAWFEALISPPLSVQAIAFPDGKLEVRANASRAAVDAWDYVLLLAGGAAALLVAVNLLVFWLVGRTVRPFGQIVGALNELQGGRFDVALPPLPGREAGAIGAAFNRMVGELQGHIETERRAVRAELQLSDSRELTRWIDHHIEQERRMIARELHDELGALLTAAKLDAAWIARKLPADTVAPMRSRFDRLLDTLNQGIALKRKVVAGLRPPLLSELGLLEALRALPDSGDIGEQGGRLAIELPDALPDVPAQTALALYRIAQEALTNVRRYAQASSVRLRLGVEGDELVLAVEDDGVGFDPAARGHNRHGLAGMAHRVQMLAGRLEIDSAPGKGTRITARVPFARMH